MPLPPAERQDRFRAAFLGLAIGDALGFPLRGIPPASLARIPNLADDFAPRPRGGQFAKGQFSDDTQLALAAAESVVREGKVDGRSAAAHLAWLWQEGVILQPPRGLAEALGRLARGAPWMSAGAALGLKCPSVLSRALVVGLFSHGHKGLAHDAGVLAVVTHKDPTCAGAAAAYAQAVALGFREEALTPTAFCEELALAARVHDPDLAEELRHLPRLLGWDPQKALAALRKVGVPQSQLKGVDGVPAHAVPVLLCAVYAVLKVPNDFRGALTLVLRAGGEADVVAALCGGLLGAHLGAGALPARLRKAVLYGDHLVDCADRLFEARQVRDTLATALASHPTTRRR